MIHHGYTHQYSNIANPYTAVTGDDCEFYRITSSSAGRTDIRGSAAARHRLQLGPGAIRLLCG